MSVIVKVVNVFVVLITIVAVIATAYNTLYLHNYTIEYSEE